jgi:hypothetical protein
VKSIFLLSVVFLSFSANASPLMWEFRDAFFDDGGSLSGTFVWDAETVTASSIEITTTGGAVFGGLSYDTCQGGQCTSEINSQSPRFIFTGGSSALFVEVDGPLTDSGGHLDIVTGTCAQSCENWGIGLSRNVISGQISAVPVPAAVWLMISAVGGLLALGRRSTK